MITKLKQVKMHDLATLIRCRPSVPDGKVRRGKRVVTVKHRVIPAGESVTVVSMRNSLFMGQQPTKVAFDEPLVVRTLSDTERGVWMTDHPQEVWQMRDLVRRAKGDVLIGGLGLGVASHLVSTLCDVCAVVTVERDPAVIELVAPHVETDLVEQADLFEYVASMPRRQFDFAFFDVWQPTGEIVWRNYVVPLRRLCRGKIDQRSVLCWNEEEMKGQLRLNLPRMAHSDAELPTSMRYAATLRDAAQRSGVAKAVPSNDLDAQLKLMAIGCTTAHAALGGAHEKLRSMIERYLRPGTDAWEREFGELWDMHAKGGDE